MKLAVRIAQRATGCTHRRSFVCPLTNLEQTLAYVVRVLVLGRLEPNALGSSRPEPDFRFGENVAAASGEKRPSASDLARQVTLASAIRERRDLDDPAHLRRSGEQMNRLHRSHRSPPWRSNRGYAVSDGRSSRNFRARDGRPAFTNPSATMSRMEILDSRWSTASHVRVSPNVEVVLARSPSWCSPNT